MNNTPKMFSVIVTRSCCSVICAQVSEPPSRQGTDLTDAPPVEPEAFVLSFNQAVGSGFYDWAALG